MTNGASAHCPRSKRAFCSEFRVYAAKGGECSEPPEGGTPNGGGVRMRPMTNVQAAPSAATAVLSFGLCHSFVLRASSFVICVLTLVIRVYQLTTSPAQTFLFGPAGGCRFTPTCSQYAMEAIRAHGALAGGWRAVKRICRCHPWGCCGHDPVPKPEFAIRHSSFVI